MSNYYDTLGVDKSAGADEIKKAYRKLAMQYHPDRHGWDKEMEAKFKEVNEAYAVLSDQEKRRNYDQFWSAEGFGWHAGWFADFDIGDIFSSVFGQGFGFGWQASQKRTIGEDIQLHVPISFEESYSWVKKEFTYKKNITCPDCGGTGAAEWSKPITCPDCGGKGHVMHETRSIFGIVQQTRICQRCHGEGTIIEKPCPRCKWNKVISEEVTKTIEIPAGIDAGMSIKMSGEWHELPGGVPGDLYITCDVELSTQWLQRKGNDLHYTLWLDPFEVVLGTKKELNLPLIWKRKIDIPAGTLDGKVIKLSGDGMKMLDRDRRGDLFILCKIQVPQKLDKKEKELYEQIKELKG